MALGRSRARRRRVDSPARVFEGIRLARDEVVYAKSCGGECGTHLVLGKQRRHQRDVLAEGFVATDLAFPRMYGHEESSARHQRAMDLNDGATELAARAVDETVERSHARELAVGERQVKEIALAELQRRVETTRRRHHRRRRVDPECIDAVCGQIARDLSGAATEITDASTIFHGGSEAIEHLAVERLAIELVEVLLGVLLRDRVVARHAAVAPARWCRLFGR